MLENFPEELRMMRRWVLWRWETRDGKKTKVLYRPNGHRAKSNASDSWTTFKEASDALAKLRFDGLGFVIADGDGIVGIDLDHQVADDGSLSALASEWAGQFNSYTERSPRGHGLHVLAKGKIAEEYLTGGKRGRRTDNIEVYEAWRFFTVTGARLAQFSATVRPCQEVLDRFMATFFAPKPKPIVVRPAPRAAVMSDQALLEAANRATNGDKFRALWDGRWEGLYQSQSQADLALASFIAFYWGPNSAEVERVFGMSGLAQRDKWRDRADYRRMTIDTALAGATETYSPPVPVPRFKRAAVTTDIAKAGPKDQDGAPRMTFRTARELVTAKFPPVEWIVHPILPGVGLAILAGKEKDGKSVMLTKLALDLATGRGLAFQNQEGEGLETTTGGALIFAQESIDQEIAQLLERYGENQPDNVWFTTLSSETPLLSLDAGGLEQIEQEVRSRPTVKIAIIDTIGRVAGAPDKRRDAYQNSTKVFAPLQALAKRLGILIIVITHVNKSKMDDVFESVTGGRGSVAVADSILVLKRESIPNTRATLHYKGRFSPRAQIALEWDEEQLLWYFRGDAKTYSRRRHFVDIQQALAAANRPLHPKDMSEVLATRQITLSPNHLRQVLHRMVNAGLIVKQNEGYQLMPTLKIRSCNAVTKCVEGSENKGSGRYSASVTDCNGCNATGGSPVDGPSQGVTAVTGHYKGAVTPATQENTDLQVCVTGVTGSSTGDCNGLEAALLDANLTPDSLVDDAKQRHPEQKPLLQAEDIEDILSNCDCGAWISIGNGNRPEHHPDCPLYSPGEPNEQR